MTTRLKWKHRPRLVEDLIALMGINRSYASSLKKLSNGTLAILCERVAQFQGKTWEPFDREDLD